jgi:hypothetical protein
MKNVMKLILMMFYYILVKKISIVQQMEKIKENIDFIHQVKIKYYIEMIMNLKIIIY